MKFILLPALLSVFFLSCADKQNENTDEVVLINEEERTQCFSYTNNNDTIIMYLRLANNSISGDLLYKFYEKDRNTGVIQGKMSGDTLMADYTFMSEGIKSVREVIYLKRNNTFMEGYGEMRESDNKMVFENRAEITFDSGIILTEFSCDK